MGSENVENKDNMKVKITKGGECQCKDDIFLVKRKKQMKFTSGNNIFLEQLHTPSPHVVTYQFLKYLPDHLH